MDGEKVAAWMEANKIEPGREHRVALAKDGHSPRAVKTVGVNQLKTVGPDGQMAPSTPYAYLTDHLISNLLYNDDITLEGFFHDPDSGALHIVISQPWIPGKHPTKEALRAWMDKQEHDIKMVDVKPANAIETANGEIYPIDFHYQFENDLDRQKAIEDLEAAQDADEGRYSYADQPPAPPAQGHAQPLDSAVATPDGWRPIGSLAIGAAVNGPDSQSSTVTGVYPQGRKQVFKITLADGRPDLAMGANPQFAAVDQRRRCPAPAWPRCLPRATGPWCPYPSGASAICRPSRPRRGMWPPKTSDLLRWKTEAMPQS